MISTLQRPLVISSNSQALLLQSHDKIKKIAIDTLAELAIALTSTLICWPFITCSIIPMIGIAIGGVAFNVLITIGIQRFIEKAHNQNIQTHAQNLSLIMRSNNFYLCNGMNAMTLVHETGHALAVQMLLGVHPTIQIFPFKGGSTSYSTKIPTTLEQKNSYNHSRFLITLAGPALALLISSIALVVGLVLKDSHPKIGAFLIGLSVGEFINHSAYAFSAWNTNLKNLGHDFIQLKAFGIHPLVAAISIIIIPLLIIGGFFLKEFLSKDQQSPRHNSLAVAN